MAWNHEENRVLIMKLTEMTKKGIINHFKIKL